MTSRAERTQQQQIGRHMHVNKSDGNRLSLVREFWTGLDRSLVTTCVLSRRVGGWQTARRFFAASKEAAVPKPQRPVLLGSCAESETKG